LTLPGFGQGGRAGRRRLRTQQHYHTRPPRWKGRRGSPEALREGGASAGDGILPAVSRRSLHALPILLLLPLLLLGGALRAQEAEDQAQAPADPGAQASTDPGGEASDETGEPEIEYPNLDEGARVQDPRFSLAREVPEAAEDVVVLAEPVITTLQGPLFPLRQIVNRLGGKLVEFEESVTLVLDGEEVIAGPGNPVMIVGREIVQLSQPPQLGDPVGEGVGRGLLVPFDFLRQSYGRLTDYELAWSPGRGELTAVRRRPQVLPVSVDVVHLQGVSTVVLQFPARLDYRLVEREEDIEVRPLRDRLEPVERQRRIRDPLVRAVRVSPDRIRLDLVPGATAESYTLESPFRLVFDVVRGEERTAEAAEDEGPALEPPRPREGLNTVVIDPGHGGEESGAVGPSGMLEKDLTLEIARSLRTELRRRLPVKVVLTRDQDALLPLDTRAAIANQNKADLFISIHLNSALGNSARGAETYFLSMEASDSRAAQTAALENSAGDGGEDEALYDLQLILWDLAQSYHLAASQRVANLIQEELNGALGLRDRGVKQAPFRVLMGAAMPAVLVELGFLSNPDEESKLRDPSYRQALVNAIVRAVSRFRAEVELSAGRLSTEPPAVAEPAAPAARSSTGESSPGESSP